MRVRLFFSMSVFLHLDLFKSQYFLSLDITIVTISQQYLLSYGIILQTVFLLEVAKLIF